MKRVYKANLSLAIALTIASSVVPYAMAGSTLVTTPNGANITANNGGKFKAGEMTNYISRLKQILVVQLVLIKLLLILAIITSLSLVVKVAVQLALRKAFMMFKM